MTVWEIENFEKESFEKLSFKKLRFEKLRFEEGQFGLKDKTIFKKYRKLGKHHSSSIYDFNLATVARTILQN